ncbi:CHAT domain-containing protein [Actinoplanes derwentensis]|uniref:CHAT domain-containing protein n=1 Tax=Actinoplanes derwentensis TaxID=113562 RepID=A0A1H1Y7I0_9ACTN|nr:CHAT domain-containing protein [Actinoplanes derwentensis]GID86692.1 hypothetical protein Ade03nite_56160 [Actinoplanes derwentensis]SDT17377.1 CHAT domain-containing protein [Actinoplanes derwentensis]
MTDERDEIDRLRQSWSDAPTGSPEAARLAGALGRQLFLRHFQQRSGTADRDEAAERLDESLTRPQSVQDATVTHVGLAALLLFRALPIPVGGDPFGAAGISLGMALMRGELNTPESAADRRRVAAHLAWVVEHQPPEADIRAVAEALLAVLGIFDGHGLAGIPAAFAKLPRLGQGLDELVDLVRTWNDDDHDQLGAAFDAVLRQLPAGHRLRPMIVAEAGALLAQRGHVGGLPSALAGMHGVIRDSLEAVQPDDPLRAETLRRLAGLLLSGAAHQGDMDSVAPILRVADTLIAAGGDPVTVGRDRFLRAMALTLRGRLRNDPDDLRAAVHDLQAAVRAVPPTDDLHSAITGMLGALIHDRHLTAGVRADGDAARELLDAVADHEPMAAYAGAMSRAIAAVQRRDRAELDASVTELTGHLAALPADYPWRSRFDAALGLAHLSRLTVGGDRDDLRLGLDGLRRAGAELAVEMSGRPALKAAAALAGLLDGLSTGDPDQAAAAAEALDRVVDAAPDLTDLAVLRAETAFARYERWGDPEQLRLAVDGLRELRFAPGHPLAAHVAKRLALAGHAAGDRAGAIDAGLAALRAYGHDTLLQAGAAHALDAGREAAGLGLLVAGWCRDAGRPEAALEAAELGRGLVLHGAMTAARVPGMLRAAGQPDLAREWAARPSPGTPLTGVIAHVMAGTPGVLDDLTPRVLATLEAAGRELRPVTVPGPGEIAATLVDADADALVYLLDGWMLLVDRTGAVSAIDLPLLRLDAPELSGYLLAHDARRAQDPDAPSWSGALDDVCEWAGKALIGALPGGRLVLIPYGVLGYVPWHAARLGERYACQDFAFSYAASARQWIAAVHRPRLAEGETVLVAGTAPDLPLVATELALVASHYPATTAAVRFSGAPVVHVAAHAVAARRPAESLLAVPGGDRSVAEILAEAYTRDPDSPGGLIVLSSCTSDFAAADFDEALTLATAFLAAGAASVVGTKWAMLEPATVCLMHMFHRFRTGGLGDRDALRAAQNWMLDPGPTLPAELAPVWTHRPARLAHPAHWAAFAHHGG